MAERRPLDIIVIGGGAAGLIAAGRAAQGNNRVIVVERNAVLARKVAITGKGRCNLTNECDVDTFIKQGAARNGRFLYSALSRFSPEDTMQLFEGLGVPLVTERGRRVFPKSERAQDICDALVKYASGNGAKIINDRAGRLIFEKGRVVGVVLNKNGEVYADRVIVATGGKSYPATGSTGDGYAMARQAGHSVEPPEASLVPVVCAGEECGFLEGLSLRNITLEAVAAGKSLYKELGELVFTDFGLSGPLVLSATAHMRGIKECDFFIDFKPALDRQRLRARIDRELVGNPTKKISNILCLLLPKRAVPVFLARWGADGEKKGNQLTAQEREGLVTLLKGFPFHVLSRRSIEEAVVTSGGVSVKEIDPSTMQSKIARGLYFAGEVIDVDCYTGGYNLQTAFSTGYAAGSAAGEIE